MRKRRTKKYEYPFKLREAAFSVLEELDAAAAKALERPPALIPSESALALASKETSEAALRRERSQRRPRGPDWSNTSLDISALEVSQLTNIFLGARWRGLWIAAVCALHVSAMWTCCAIWVNCAQASFGGSPRVIWLACCAVLLPLSCAGGTA